MNCGNTDRHCRNCGIYGCADDIDDDGLCRDPQACADRALTDPEFA